MPEEEKNIEKKESLSEEEIERLELLQKADEVKGEQLTLDEEGHFKNEKEIKDYALGKIDDPDLKHEIYYKGIQKLLRENLPSGSYYKGAKEIVYEEKNILINRGNKKDENGIRGSDGRMAFETDLEMALNIIVKWISEKGTLVDLYKRFFEKNVELGYRKTNEKIPKKLDNLV